MDKSRERRESLVYHAKPKPGKIEVIPTKKYNSQRDLALAYTPGVAIPCQEIERDKDNTYKYTNKGNLVAVITNGTAVLGLGDIGPEASKPVMEGKAVLFKIFADIDVFDIEINEKDPKKFVEIVKSLSPTFGGINLEDIKAPEAFQIEKDLIKELDIPVMHDDQHGTAMISCAALINAIDLVNKKIKSVKLVMSGAGSSAISSAKLYISFGLKRENIIMVDSKGVINNKRTDLNDEKKFFITKRNINTLEEAMIDSDVFIGLSTGDIVTSKMLKTMAKDPIVFAMSNPNPEINYDLAMSARKDLIMATGRSDFPNQVNNVLGFPFIFRGALDVRAKIINEEMKIAAAHAIAALAREDVPDEVAAAMGGERPRYGKEYIIPSTFDPRLISVIPVAVAKAAIKSGVARKEIKDFEVYKDQLKQRLDPSVTIMQGINAQIKKTQKRVVFAEGEDENTLKAAIAFKNSGLGTPILVAKEERVKERLKEIGLDENFKIEIVNSTNKEKRNKYAKLLYKKLQREGLLERDCDRLIRNDRVMWGSCMVASGDADAMVTGNTRRYSDTLDKIKRVIDPRPGEIMFGLNMVVSRGKTIFMADTHVHEYPNAQQLADIAISCARVVRLFGFDPKIAFLSHSTFGIPKTQRTKHIRDAVEILKNKKIDFKFDGEMQPDVAMDEKYKELYPFSEIVGNANILIMPAQHSAAISLKMMKTLGGAKIIGPFLVGLGQPIEIAPLRSSTSDILNLASVAAYSSEAIDYKKN